MTVGAHIAGLTLAEWAIIAAVVAYAARELARAFGRSPEALREENIDLLRRNGELERRIGELETSEMKLRQQVAVLEAQVAELKRHDLESALAAIREHELNADGRWQQSHVVQRETNKTLTRIADLLTPSSP